MDRVSIFVDVQNIYYTTRQQYARHFDYNAFWARAARGREVVKAAAYAIAGKDEKLRLFHNILRGIGFEVKLRPFIQRSDGTAKGDWDVGITLDVIEYADKSDVIVLASGDGDFDLLAQKVISRYGCAFEVFGVPRLTAASLMNSASRFIPIDEKLLLKPGAENQNRDRTG